MKIQKKRVEYLTREKRREILKWINSHSAFVQPLLDDKKKAEESKLRQPAIILLD